MSKKMTNTTTFPFEVDTTTDVPLWVQLRQRLIYLINSGYFKPGDQLPTVRGLASDISINYNTVNKAYLSLVTDGYLESTRGRGVFVRDLDAEMDTDYAQEVDVIMGDCVAACRDLGMSLDDVQKCLELKIRQIKKAEGKDAEKNDDGTGRILTIEVGAKARRTQAGA